MSGEFGRYRERFPHAVAISAKTGEGITELLGEIGAALRPIREFVELKIPHDKPQVMARLHAVAQVIERNYKGKAARFKARIPPHLRAEFEAFIVTE
jgi:GTP-binding protein HflX